MKDRAYGKINLTLDIESKREDGYHNINSIMIPINFADEIEIDKTEKMKYVSNSKMIFNEKNTIVKALDYMIRTYDIRDNFEIRIFKRIPTQAGLGGGSSDGASVIRILNSMYELNMSDEEIEKACMAVGADVLFTYYNKPARVYGIGEKIEFFKMRKSRNLLIVKPKEGVSTKDAYNNLDVNDCVHPDVQEVQRRLERGMEYIPLLGNSLEKPSIDLCPVIDEIKEDLRNYGFSNPLMSGSGSSVFALSDNYELLQKAKNELRKKYKFVIVTKLLK